MQYDVILIDMFNLFYRRKNSSIEKDPIAVARNIISFINDDVKKHLIKNGNLFLLYDPIPKSDLGYSKTFKYTFRQSIVHSYKSNRKHDRDALTVIDLVRKYYLHRGPNIITVIDNLLEADDYAESIIEENKDKKILIISTDEDWCRYLSSNVEMMNWDWSKMLTLDGFYKKYKFYPSITGVCVWKACFGDGSDNLTGALQLKGLKRSNDIKLSAFEFIKYLGLHKEITVEDVENYKKASFMNLFKKENKTVEEEFFCKLLSFDPKYEVSSTFFSNLTVIKSRCDSYKKYASAKDVDDSFNSLIENALNFSNNKSTKKFRFGKIKG